MSDPVIEAGPEHPDWCFSHARLEPLRPEAEGGFFRVCGECMHVFTTPEDLIRDDLTLFAEMGTPRQEPVSAEAIASCPHCAHDF